MSEMRDGANAATAAEMILRRFALFHRIILAGVMLVGLAAIAAWLFEVPRLAQLDRSWSTINANTAICVLGLAIAIRRVGEGGSSRTLPNALAGVIGVLAISSWAASIFTTPLFFDELLVRDLVRTIASARMAPVVSTDLVLLAAAILCIDIQVRGRAPSEWLILAVFVITGVALDGYLYDALLQYRAAAFSTVALQSALCLLGLGLAMLFARPKRGLMSCVTSASRGGALLRRLLPVVIIVPAVLGWLRIHGQNAGWFGGDVGAALLIESTVLLLTVVLWLSAVPLVHGEARERQARDDLAARARRLEQVFQAARDGMFVYPSTPAGPGRYLDANAVGCRLLGYTLAELRHLSPSDTLVKGLSPTHDAMLALSAGEQLTFERTLAGKDGRHIPVRAFTSLLDEDGSISLSVVRDLTDELKLQSQLLQTQKMESLGRFAGGIAHDFNNLLTVINGMAEMVLEHANLGAVADDVREIRSAGERAAGLTRQLLAFSRQQVMSTTVLDVNDSLQNLASMLARILGEDVTLVVKQGFNVPRVRADGGQLDQVFLNLVSNARDAMPHGGCLTIETALWVVGTDVPPAERSLPPGRYAALSVSDTGVGMEPEIVAKIFDPFFTTKPPGSGTGLGLSTVFGIVRQSGGDVVVFSQPGNGTTFNVYLPEADEEPVVVAAQHQIRIGGNEHVLLVEDESGLRAMASRMLQRAGYAVKSAESGDAALALLTDPACQVDLLLTDVILPGMSGRALAEQAAKLRPGLKVLYSSGYTDDAVLRHGVRHDQNHFLSKPYSYAQLTEKVREALDG